MTSINLIADRYRGPLNDQLNLSGLLDTILAENNFTGLVRVDLTSFSGIDLNVTLDSSQYRNLLSWRSVVQQHRFQISSLDLLFNGKILKMTADNGRTCDEAESLDAFNQTNGYTFFTSMQTLSLKSSRFTRKLCPLVFKTVSLDTLYTFGPLLKFYKENSDAYSKLDGLSSAISTLHLRSAVIENLDRELLHPHVYANTFQIKIECSIGKIEVDVFKELTALSELLMSLNNFRGFLHSNGIEWMQYLNYHVSPFEPEFYANLTITVASRDLIDKKRIWIQVECMANDLDLYPVSYFPFFGYQFPDEYFCLFARYPHQKMIFTNVIGPISQCSCTCLWIYKYVALYAHHRLDAFAGFRTEMVRACNVNNYSRFEAAYNACNVSSRIEACGTALALGELKQSIGNYQHGYFLLYDIQNGIGIAGEYLIKKLGPWISLFSFLTNLIVVITVFYAQKKKAESAFILSKMKQPFFSYTMVNSILNVVYSFVYFLDWTFPCVSTPVDERYSRDNCLQKEVWLSTLTSTLKLVANLTLVQISLNPRYLLVDKNHFKFLVKAATMSKSKFFASSLVTSALLSVVVIFHE